MAWAGSPRVHGNVPAVGRASLSQLPGLPRLPTGTGARGALLLISSAALWGRAMGGSGVVTGVGRYHWSLVCRGQPPPRHGAPPSSTQDPASVLGSPPAASLSAAFSVMSLVHPRTRQDPLRVCHLGFLHGGASNCRCLCEALCVSPAAGALPSSPDTVLVGILLAAPPSAPGPVAGHRGSPRRPRVQSHLAGAAAASPLDGVTAHAQTRARGAARAWSPRGCGTSVAPLVA